MPGAVSRPPATAIVLPPSMFDALASLGASMRKAAQAQDASAVEFDLWLPAHAAGQVDAITRSHDFHRFRAAGHDGHRFYLGFHEQRWVKLDFKLTPNRPPRPSWLRSILRRLPAGWRRLGPVVVFVGPDGAGKGTVIEGVVKSVPVAVDVARLGRGAPRHRRRRNREKAAAANGEPIRVPTWRLWLEPLFVTRMMLRRSFQLVAIYASAWRGRVVLCDRHPLEALAIDPRQTRLARALERFVVSRLMPWPDRIVVLDAPGEVMFARKREHSPERLESWRRGYAAALSDPRRRATFVATDGAVEEAVNAASTVVWEALATCRGWPASGS